MDKQKIDYVIRNAKRSMEIEGFVIDEELEEIGRKILSGELSINDYVADYIAQYKQNAAAQANEV